MGYGAFESFLNMCSRYPPSGAILSIFLVFIFLFPLSYGGTPGIEDQGKCGGPDVGVKSTFLVPLLDDCDEGRSFVEVLEQSWTTSLDFSPEVEFQQLNWPQVDMRSLRKHMKLVDESSSPQQTTQRRQQANQTPSSPHSPSSLEIDESETSFFPTEAFYTPLKDVPSNVRRRLHMGWITHLASALANEANCNVLAQSPSHRMRESSASDFGFLTSIDTTSSSASSLIVPTASVTGLPRLLNSLMNSEHPTTTASPYVSSSQFARMYTNRFLRELEGEKRRQDTTFKSPATSPLSPRLNPFTRSGDNRRLDGTIANLSRTYSQTHSHPTHSTIIDSVRHFSSVGVDIISLSPSSVSKETLLFVGSMIMGFNSFGCVVTVERDEVRRCQQTETPTVDLFTTSDDADPSSTLTAEVDVSTSSEFSSSSTFTSTSNDDAGIGGGQDPSKPLLSDRYYSLQWHLWDANTYGIHAEAAWDESSGSGSGFIVGVVDDGCYVGGDLVAGGMWVNPGEVCGNGVDDDGNGYVDDCYGYNFADDNNDTSPHGTNSHGTSVSSVIASRPDDWFGMSGVCWGCKIMCLKVEDVNGSFRVSKVIEAINYMILMGVKLSNHSYGDFGYSESEYIAIGRLKQAGHLMVAAAGNNGKDIDQNNFVPAGYDHDNILSISSSNANGFASDFANWGFRSVDMFAPGTNIVAAVNPLRGYDYALVQGTSYSSPIAAAGVAALWARNETMNYLEVKHLVMDTAHMSPRGTLNGKCVSAGIFNFANASATLTARLTSPTTHPRRGRVHRLNTQLGEVLRSRGGGTSIENERWGMVWVVVLMGWAGAWLG
eukprot:GHVN01023178.1.p1 GENE.GHVN01023178.1~~GHVN01023178.1.p1  ORF type:complete len:828 (-),score=141.01 GHVN01023178.1:265-2748(-)